MSNLYKKIEYLCEKKGVTKSQLCKDVGISAGNLSDLKMGRKKTFAAQKLSRMAEYFGCTMSYLMDDDVPVEEVNHKTMRERWHGVHSQITKEDMSQYSEKITLSIDELYDAADILNVLRDRSEMKTLFRSAKNATPEQIMAVTALLDSFKKD